METMHAPEKIETKSEETKTDNSQQLLADILTQLKSMQRHEMFDVDARARDQIDIRFRHA